MLFQITILLFFGVPQSLSGCMTRATKKGCYHGNSTNGSLLHEFAISDTDVEGGQPWLSSMVCSCVKIGEENGVKIVAVELQQLEHESCLPASYDFEKGPGSLRSWTQEGTAFAHQPTYGNNPLNRSREASGLQGDYWIGGYEYRPSPEHPAGAIQGDEPIGKLTSPRFFISGPSVNFLVGGGCNISVVRVELIVDQKVVRSATGTCFETMTRHHWDVGEFVNKTAQLRLVDQLTTAWGHINFDDFRGDIAFCKVACRNAGDPYHSAYTSTSTDQCVADNVETCKEFSPYCAGYNGTSFLYDVSQDRCTNYGTFIMQDLDHALSKHMIATALVMDVGGCAMRCFSAPGCISFNLEYEGGGMKTCELNKSRKELDMASFVKRKGFAYFSL